ncbi:RNA binding protein, heterogenous nuclear RNP-K like protein [Coemansia sp. RSA 2702]|nr:RNA binding protein, heterogenous nuclear RNP-K like protein [Coemansia sp. RSA 2702]
MAQSGFANSVSFEEDHACELRAEPAAAEHPPSPSPESPAAPESTALSPSKAQAGTPKNKRGRRSRRGSRASRSAAAADPASEDLNLNVEAGWSEDDRDDKEPPSKRLATRADDGSPSVAKKADGALEDFTIRAVVTRKDVDLIFGHASHQKASLESDTATRVSIIAGKDDPEIVVDRVLSIRGHIDCVAAAYKFVADGMLAIKESAASASAKRNSGEPAATADNADDDEDDGSVPEEPAGGVDEAEPVPADEPSADISSLGAAADANPSDAVAAVIAAVADAATDDANGQKGVSAESKPQSSPDSLSSRARITLRMLVPHRCVGSIMGHGGKTINKIRDTASVSIHTSETTLPRSSERIVELVGAPPSIQKAIRLIAEALTKDIQSYYSSDHYVPAANLPSAMTVDTQARKRKDTRRPGHIDNHAGGRSHGGRTSGFRSNPADAGQSQARGYSGSGRTTRHTAGGAGNRNDRHSRYPNNRQAGRNRGPDSLSGANRMPIGGGGDGAPSYSNQYGMGGGFRGNGQSGMRPGAPMGYGGYAVPAPYPMYAAQGAIAAGGPAGSQYNPTPVGNRNLAPMGASPPTAAYGGGYGAAATPYQFAMPAGYGYAAAAPVQGAYGARPMHHAAAAAAGSSHQQRSYSGYGNHTSANQPSMGMGTGRAMSSNAPASSAGQTVQQIYVPGDRVGAVIGRRGETINSIRRSTNARVDIQDSAQGAKERLIVITGEYEQVRSAFDQIKKQIEGARPSGRSF